MTTGDRIKKLRKKLKITREKLSNEISVSKYTIYQYENNIITTIPTEKIVLLAEALQTTPNYLLGLEDTLEKHNNLHVDNLMPSVPIYLKDDLSSDEKSKTVIESEEKSYIQEDDNYECNKHTDFYLKEFITSLSGQSFNEILENQNYKKLVPIPKKFEEIDDYIYCFKMNDNSMNNVFQVDSIVVIENEIIYDYGNGDIIALFYNNEVIIRRFYAEEEHIILKPDSSSKKYKTIFIQKKLENFDIIGKAVWHMNSPDIEETYKK